MLVAQVATYAERVGKEDDALRAQLDESTKRADALHTELDAAKAQENELSAR